MNPNMTCDAFEALLPAWLEQALDDPAAADAELHLAACTSCRALVADLERITTAAATLPDLAPSRDLWAGIEARIATPVVALPARAARPRWRLGAIAAGLVAVTALGTWQLARRTAPPGEGVASAPVAPPATPLAAPDDPGTQRTPGGDSPAVPVAGRVPAPGADVRVTYADEIGKLHALVRERTNDLDPATVAIIEGSLATIDSAIVEARAALDRDPASGFLEAQLNKSLERKLGLLRKAALLASST